MSGGSKNYIFCAIESELCDQMYDEELNDLIKDVAELAHDLEWWISSDIGKEEYLETVSRFKKKWFESDRNERLKGYVDANVEELRNELYTLIGISMQ